MNAISAELARLDTLSKAHPQPGSDSAITDLTARLRQIRARARAGLVGVPGLFDLLASVESSSLPPTDAQERLITTIITNFTNAGGEINEITTKKMPVLRA